MTTASLHREMVEALRDVVRRMRKSAADPMKSWDAGECIVATAADDWADDVDAALEGWEKRPPLRDSSALRQVVMSFGSFTMDDVLGLLDALEPLLYGDRG